MDQYGLDGELVQSVNYSIDDSKRGHPTPRVTIMQVKEGKIVSNDFTNSRGMR